MCFVIFGFIMAATYSVAYMGNCYKLVSKICNKLTFAYKHKIKLYLYKCEKYCIKQNSSIFILGINVIRFHNLGQIAYL